MKVGDTFKPARSAWFNGKLVNSVDPKVHLAAIGVNYGAGVYDVMRFRGVGGKAGIFRLKDHIERFFYSASVLKLNLPFDRKAIGDAVINTVKENEVTEGEIRIISVCGFGRRGLYPPKSGTDTVISITPSHDIEPREKYSVKVSKIRRPSPDATVIDAKISGHYSSSILAIIEAEEIGADSVIQLDARGFVAEGPIANFFAVVERTLFTPPLGAILPGITRDTVIKLARSQGIKVREEFFGPDFLTIASEAFFSGTSLGIYPITELCDRALSSRENNSITLRIRDAWKKAITGTLGQEFNHWITIVE